jgi:hypothetical protein
MDYLEIVKRYEAEQRLKRQVRVSEMLKPFSRTHILTEQQARELREGKVPRQSLRIIRGGKK